MNDLLGYTRPKSAQVRWLKSFCWRLAVAVIILVVVVLGFASGGAPGQAVGEGVSYVLTKDHDFSGYEKKLREAINLLPELSVPEIKQDLEVKVSTSGTSGEMFGLPASGELARGFGWQKDDSDWPYYHEGVELSVDKGAFVRAVLPGKVVQVVTDEERGGEIIIEHTQDCATLYRWLEDIEVKTGQKVTDDQVIGIAADTSLYFQLREGDHLVDPLSRLQE